MSEIAELKKQIAALQARVNELEGTEQAAVEEQEPKRFEGRVQRDARGEVISNAAESYEDRQEKRLERMDAAIAEQIQQATAGCPEGYGRDPFGRIKRISTGPDGTMIFGQPYTKSEPEPRVIGGYNPESDG